MRILLEKREVLLWLMCLLLFLLFCLSRFSNQVLRQLIGAVLIFLMPGILVFRSQKVEEMIAFSPVISVCLVIVLTFFLNIWFNIKLDEVFLDKLFPILFVGIFLYRVLFRKTQKRSMDTSNSKVDIYFIFVLLISVAFRSLIILKIGSLIGTDIVRFASISHAMKLKEKITLNLRPYELASSFFYFPLSFTLPLIIETLGVDAITSITYFSFFFDILSITAFYLLADKILNHKKALYATFFYSMFFDVPLDYLMSRGVFTFAIAFLPCFLSMYLFLEYFNGRKKKTKLLLFSYLFLFLTHWFLFFALFAFFLSLVLYEYSTKRKFSKSRNIMVESLKVIPIILTMILPILTLFRPSYPTQEVEKAADWKMYEIELERASLKDKVTAIIFENFATVVRSVSYPLGFLVSILTFNELMKGERKVIAIFFIFLIFSSLFYLHSVTWKRSADYIKIIYPISFSFLFDHPLFIGISLFSSPFIENTPVWYYYHIPDRIEKRYEFFFDTVNDNEVKAFEFIRKNTPENSTFLIDSGGAGCLGGQPFSHGERIFPLTSRKVFYFMNSCPMKIDWKDYQHRVELYRKISINPNDEKTLDELKNKYNVTHIYIGPNHVGLNPKLFKASKNYELIYHEEGVYIFKIV